MHNSKLQNHPYNLGLQYQKKTTQENTSALKIRSCIPTHYTSTSRKRLLLLHHKSATKDKQKEYYVSHKNFLSTQNLTLHATHKEKLENELLDNSVRYSGKYSCITSENTTALHEKCWKRSNHCIN